MEFQAKLIRPETWLITSPHGCTTYLVAGSKFGVVIDTGESLEDLHAFVTTLTDKPVEIAMNTHGHFDHTGGNGFFKVALMGKLAAEVAKEPNGPYCKEHIAEYPLDYPIVVIEDGFTIDLGDRVLEAFAIDGHSPDSLAFLDYKERILFGGDAISQFVPNNYKCAHPQPSMINYVKTMANILTHRDDFDYLCGGHGRDLMPATYVDSLMIIALRALRGEAEPMPEPPEFRKRELALHPEENPMKNLKPEDVGHLEDNGVNMDFHKKYLWDTTKYNIVSGT